MGTLGWIRACGIAGWSPPGSNRECFHAWHMALGYQILRAGRILHANPTGLGTPASGEVTETREAPTPATIVRSHPVRVVL
jgi:hypothetical protein